MGVSTSPQSCKMILFVLRDDPYKDLFLGNLLKIFLFLPRFFPKKSVIIFDLDYIFKDDVGGPINKLIQNMYIISIYLAQKNSPNDSAASYIGLGYIYVTNL